MGLRLKKAEEEAGIPLPSTSVHYYGYLAFPPWHSSPCSP